MPGTRSTEVFQQADFLLCAQPMALCSTVAAGDFFGSAILLFLGFEKRILFGFHCGFLLQVIFLQTFGLSYWHRPSSMDCF